MMNEADTCRFITPKIIVNQIADYGIDFDHLKTEAKQPDADGPIRNRRERAQRVRRVKKDFFNQFCPRAKVILESLLEKYAKHGSAEFIIPNAPKVPPNSEHGNVFEISKMFGGAENLRKAGYRLQFCHM